MNRSPFGSNVRHRDRRLFVGEGVPQSAYAIGGPTGSSSGHPSRRRAGGRPARTRSYTTVPVAIWMGDPSCLPSRESHRHHLPVPRSGSQQTRPSAEKAMELAWPSTCGAEQFHAGTSVPYHDGGIRLAAPQRGEGPAVRAEVQAARPIPNPLASTGPVPWRGLAPRPSNRSPSWPWVWVARSLPSGLTDTCQTGSERWRVRTTDRVRTSQKMTFPLVPPVANVRPSGRNERANVVDPLLAGSVSISRRDSKVDERDGSVGLGPRHERALPVDRLAGRRGTRHGRRRSQRTVRPRRCLPERSHATTLPSSPPARAVRPEGTTATLIPLAWAAKVWTIEPEARSHTRTPPSNERPRMLVPSGVNARLMIHALTGRAASDRCAPVRRSSTANEPLGSAGIVVVLAEGQEMAVGREATEGPPMENRRKIRPVVAFQSMCLPADADVTSTPWRVKVTSCLLLSGAHRVAPLPYDPSVRRIEQEESRARHRASGPMKSVATPMAIRLPSGENATLMNLRGPARGRAKARTRSDPNGPGGHIDQDQASTSFPWP